METIPEKSFTPKQPSNSSNGTNNVDANTDTTTDAVTTSVTKPETTSNQTSQTDRKRRDNMNGKIQELLTLIPSSYFQEYYQSANSNESNTRLRTNRTGDGGTYVKLRGTGTRDGKPNKGQILTQAIEYILDLQDQIDAKNRQEIELIVRLRNLSEKAGVPIEGVDLDYTCAEFELAKVGLGPLANPSSSSKEGDEVMSPFRQQ